MTEHESWNNNLCPPGEPIPGKTLRADGWGYLDPPGSFLKEIWAQFLGIIGEPEVDYYILAGSIRTDRDGKEWHRGQLVVSPEGMARLATFADGDDEPTPETT